MKQEGLKLNDTHHLPLYAENINTLVEGIHNINKNTEALVFTSMETGPEANV
jgi:hypothetical protein